MHPPDASTVLVRHGELGTKSNRVQSRMEEILAGNLRSMLADRNIAGEVSRERGRLFIETDTETVDAATQAATDTFGVVSASPAMEVSSTLPEIESALAETARVAYDNGKFAVRARRAGSPDTHDFSSMDIEKRGGAAVWEAVVDQCDPTVDLDNPDVTFYVECRKTKAYVFLHKHPGPGGFPVGTQGTVVALISGGIDSPVAAWEMNRRGCEVVPVYLDVEHYGGPDHVARAIEAVRRLATYVPGHRHGLYHVPIGQLADSLMSDMGSTRMLTFRRVMVRIADRIADEVDAHAVVTGESLGQKSSQTGQNLRVTSAAIDRPIHRPLLNMDKQEIITLAKSIGTFSDAQIPAGCNRIAPDNPATRPTLEHVREVEPASIFASIPDVIAAAERIDVTPRTTSRQERVPTAPRTQRPSFLEQ